MSQPVLSEKQLALGVLRRLPHVTWLVLAIQLAVLGFTSESVDGSLFGFAFPEENLTKILAFDVRSPSRFGGVTILSSFFAHESAVHFRNNALFFFLFGWLLENKKGKQALLVPLALGHCAALSGAMLAHHFYAQSPWVIGMSGGVLALVYPAVRLWNSFLALALVLLLGLAFLTLSVSLAVSHVPALLFGVVAGLVLKSEKRP